MHMIQTEARIPWALFLISPSNSSAFGEELLGSSLFPFPLVHRRHARKPPSARLLPGPWGVGEFLTSLQDTTVIAMKLSGRGSTSRR